MRLPLLAFTLWDASWDIAAFHPSTGPQQRHHKLGSGVGGKPLWFSSSAITPPSDKSLSSPSDDGVHSNPLPKRSDSHNHREDGDGIHDHHVAAAAGFSKAKWKKKRFLLLKDVMELVDQGSYDKASRKAKEAVRRMTTLYEQTGHVEYLPNLQAFNLWIHTLAKNARNPNAGQEAEQVLRELQGQPMASLQPSAITYTSVMDAYASRGQAEHAERILMELLEEYDRRPSRKDLQLTSVTFDTVLNAWASRGNIQGAERAEEILKRLELLVETSTSRDAKVRPTPHSYATVIHAWATCHGGTEAAQRAQHLLTTLLEGSRPVQVEPDTVIFNAAMHAWANSGCEQAGIRASAILDQMKRLASTGNNRNCRPDIVSYNTVLSAWSHSTGHAQAGTQGEKILQDMITAYRANPTQEVAPNTVSYNCVLHAWSHSPLEGAASRAEKVLEYMIAATSSSNVDNDGATTRLPIAPDVYSFTAVLNAIAKSKDPDKASRAQEWLHRLLHQYKTTRRPELWPTQIPFNTVMNACAFSALHTTEAQRMKALEVAVATFSEMREHGIDPDEVTYYNMMKCASNLLSHSRRKRQDMILPLFESCCQAGLVTEPTWNQVCKAAGYRIIQESLGVSLDRENSYRSLPMQWKRNISRAANKSREQSQGTPGVTPLSSTGRPRGGPVQRLRSISEPSYQSGRDL